MLLNIILVAIGGAFGSAFRFLIGEAVIALTRFPSSTILFNVFPLSTIFVNIIGCFLAGIFHFVFINHLEGIGIYFRMLLMTGFLGGFTTFSTFSLDVLRLFYAGQIVVAGSYVILSMILSILAIFFGFYLASLIAN